LEEIKEKQVLTRDETAAYLGIHLNTLDRSDVPRIHIGARVLFRKATVDKYLSDMERNPGMRRRFRNA